MKEILDKYQIEIKNNWKENKNITLLHKFVDGGKDIAGDYVIVGNYKLEYVENDLHLKDNVESYRKVNENIYTKAIFY